MNSIKVHPAPCVCIIGEVVSSKFKLSFEWGISPDSTSLELIIAYQPHPYPGHTFS